MKIKQIFKEGLIDNNPVLVQLVGMCSILGVSTSLLNALGMGISVIFVLTLSNIVLSLLRNFIPDKVRIPAYVVVIATFVTIVDMGLNAFAPALYNALGLFIPLIVVNCIILARAERFASKNSVGLLIVDGLASGLGYTIVISILAILREFFGAGEFLGMQVFGESIKRIGIIAQAPGAFIVLGIMYAVFNHLKSKNELKKLQGGDN